jgi:abortive infection bacteriophage resistance protein
MPPTSVPGESAVRHVGGFLFDPGVVSRTLKPHLSYSDQIKLLKSRGLGISDEVTAAETLAHYGYYRLAGYSFPLRDVVVTPYVAANFKTGATLELVREIAEFDKALRLLMLNGIETVEIATRTAIAHRLGRLDPQAHLNPKLLDGRFCNGSTSRHQEWIVKYNKLVADSKEDFVVHHRTVYGGSMPIWVGIELWSFGMLSRFFEGMQQRDRAHIANQFGALDSDVFGS